MNKSLSCPTIVNQFSIFSYTQFPYSDPRTNHHISNSQVYNEEFSLSVSVNWFSRCVLFGIPSLNIVLLFSIDNISGAIGVCDHGMGYQGYGKSIAWLSSTIHVYDIESDGLTDDTQPVLVYPNSEQIIYPWMNPSLIRLVTSYLGNVAIFDILVNPAMILSSPPRYYPDTNSQSYTSINVPCIPGTYRNFSGIELCLLCPNGTYSSECIPCQSDDLLMQNMFSLNTQSIFCLFVSPVTWTFVVFAIGILVAIIITIHELFCPNDHSMREKTKRI